MADQTTKIGVMPAPPGVEPDFSGSRTPLQRKIIVVYATMTVLSTLALCLRLYTRIYIRRTTGFDDFFVILSWLGCVAWVAVCLEAFQYGFGQHLWNVTPDQLVNYIKIIIGIIVVYVWTPALTKLSLLALYHRLNPERSVRLCIYALAALVCGYSLAITIVAAGPCNPGTHKDQKCLTDLNLFMAIINIITDFFILCLPLPMLRALQLPPKQKMLLGLVFSIGSGVVVISTVRIIYVYQLISNPDTTYNQAAACVYSTVEMNGGVICACIALLKPLIQRYMPRLLSLSIGSDGSSGSRRLKMFKKRKESQSFALQSADADIKGDRPKIEQKIAQARISVTKTYSVVGSKGSKGLANGNTNSDSMEDLFKPM